MNHSSSGQAAQRSAVRFNASSLVKSGVRHNWRTSAAVAAGVAIATAVIVGALLVGDSMRGSLRELTIQRLGATDSIVAPGGFFDAPSIADTLGIQKDQVAAIMLFDRAVIETVGSADTRRAGAVQTIGCDESFWRLDTSGVSPAEMPDDQSVVLTQSVADDLGVSVGDQVTVRLPDEQAVPADSPLGRKDVQTKGIPRLTVVDILPDRGLARFSLSPTQATPKNVFLSRQLIGEVLLREDQANVALTRVSPDPAAMRVSLDDLGLTLERVTESFDEETVFDYYSVTSDRLMIDAAATERIIETLPEGSVTPALTYLANAIERADGKDAPTITYSTITAIDSSDDLPLNYTRPAEQSPEQRSDAEPLSNSEQRVPMVLNSWAAERLDASIGTPLKIAYYEPEVEHGKEIERSFDAVVTDIVPIVEPTRPYFRRRQAVFDSPPTRYNDPHLTPTVPGVTDQDSMSDWDTPFELTRVVPTEDDQYWKNHRLTPKAFIPLADGKRLFSSRFGDTTGLRLDLSVAQNLEQLSDELTEGLQPHLDELGWKVRPIRAMQMAASKGTTPFDGLFLALSCFVILAAVMLIAMLFRLGLANRSRELGTLMAVGMERSQVTKIFLGEGLLIALAGVLLGVLGGIAYAWIVLSALRTYWVGAVTVPFLTFHATPQSLIGGAMIGLAIGLATLWWTLRSMLKSQAVMLLSGRDDTSIVGSELQNERGKGLRRIALIMFLVALAAGLFGALSGGQNAALGFVGGGMMLLVSVLIMVYDRLRSAGQPADGHSHSTTGYSLSRLARSNAARSPLRSTLTIGLMATASFLIIAITAFRLQPSIEGTGGFDLVADSAQPLYEDLSDPQVRRGLMGTDAQLMEDATVVAFRVRSGQDASCNNLYQATEPTVFGVPDSDAEALRRFRFYAAGKTESEMASAWSLLNRRASGGEDDPIPLIIDQNTAMWSLQMIKGVGERKSFTYDNQTLHFEVVGLLENSLLQGRLMIGEKNFETCFPDISGYRFMMVETPDDQADAVAKALEVRLGDIGLDAKDAGKVLSGMMAVQNTYLRTFQSLGGLGLLLGTIGLAIAQMRNVLERRSELAVMRSVGFTRQRLARLVMGETASLLIVGIGCGACCAALAVLPHALFSSAAPPLVEPLLLVLGIVLFGLVAGLIAAGKVVRMPLLDSLRGS